MSFVVSLYLSSEQFTCRGHKYDSKTTEIAKNILLDIFTVHNTVWKVLIRKPPFDSALKMRNEAFAKKKIHTAYIFHTYVCTSERLQRSTLIVTRHWCIYVCAFRMCNTQKRIGTSVRKYIFDGKRFSQFSHTFQERLSFQQFRKILRRHIDASVCFFACFLPETKLWQYPSVMCACEKKTFT